MRNGETRTVGSATILCNVRRSSWRSRDDKWMGSLAPRHTSSRTVYTVVGPDGRAVACSVEGYKNAVRIALEVKP